MIHETTKTQAEARVGSVLIVGGVVIQRMSPSKIAVILRSQRATKNLLLK